jgi:hypothetical protein
MEDIAGQAYEATDKLSIHNGLTHRILRSWFELPRQPER